MPLSQKARIEPEYLLPESSQNGQQPDRSQRDRRATRANVVVTPVIALQNLLGGLVVARVEDVDPLTLQSVKDTRVAVRGDKIGATIHRVFNKSGHEGPAVELNVQSRPDAVFDQKIMRPVYRDDHPSLLGPLFDILDVPL